MNKTEVRMLMHQLERLISPKSIIPAGSHELEPLEDTFQDAHQYIEKSAVDIKTMLDNMTDDVNPQLIFKTDKDCIILDCWSTDVLNILTTAMTDIIEFAKSQYTAD